MVPDHEEKRVAALELVSAAARITDSVMQTFGIQLLNNADQVCQAILNSENISQDEKANLLSLMENMIKSPFRRQIGRLKSASRSFDDAKQKINSLS
jgi:hypothetical protein